MYKVGSIYDKAERLNNIQYADNNSGDIRQTPKLDLLSKSIQEFPQLQTVLHYYLARSNDIRSNEIYTLCHTDFTSALLRVMTNNKLGLYGYDQECNDNAQLDWSRDINWIEIIGALYKDNTRVTDKSIYALQAYFDDILDTFIGFYIADIEQKIGSKDPFGLKQLIYKIRLIGLILHIVSKQFADLNTLITQSYQRYIVQQLNKPTQDNVIVANIFTAIYGHAVHYFSLNHIESGATNYWDALLHALLLDDFYVSNPDGFNIIISTYRRLSNFLKTYDPKNIPVSDNIIDAISTEIQSLLVLTNNKANLQDMLKLSHHLNVLFDDKRIIDEQTSITNNRLALLYILKQYYDSFVLFSDRIADVYTSSTNIQISDKTLFSILL